MHEQANIRNERARNLRLWPVRCVGLSFPSAPAKGESIKLLRAAVEQGITLFDTVHQAYGDNEELVGEALAPWDYTPTLLSRRGLI